MHILNKSIRSILLLAFFCVGVYFLNLIFMFRNGIGGADSHWNIGFAVDFLNQMTWIMQQNTLNFWEKIVRIIGLFDAGALGQVTNWPSFSFFFTSLLLLCFGRTMQNLVLLNNIIFLFFSMVSVFFIAKKIQDESLGLLAAALLALMPGVFMFSREYMLDYPLIALVASGIMFLIYTEGFKNRSYSILFGVISGIGILTKAQYVFFVIGPALYMACKAFRGSNKVRGNILISLLVPIMMSSIWWLHHIRQIIGSFLVQSLCGYMPGRFNIGTSIIFGYSHGAIHSYIFYLVQIIAYSFAFLSPAYFFLIIKDIKSLFKMPYFKELGLWLVVPYVILTFISTKFSRYIFPALPVLAIMAAYVMQNMHNKKNSRFVLVFLILLSVGQFLVLSFPPTVKLHNVLDKFFPYIQEVGIVSEDPDSWNKDMAEFRKAYNVVRYADDLKMKPGDYATLVNYSESGPYYPTIYLSDYIKLYFPAYSENIIPLIRVTTNVHGHGITDSIRNHIKHFMVLGKDEKIYSLSLEYGSRIDEKELVEQILAKNSAGSDNFLKIKGSVE